MKFLVDLSHYSLADPPFGFKFDVVRRTKLNAYDAWFRDTISQRVATLTEVSSISAVPGRDAVEAADAWLSDALRCADGVVESRHLADAWLYPSLNDLQLSLAFDVGLLFGESIRACKAGVTWVQELDSPRNVDYGHVVLAGVFTVPANPMRPVLNRCMRIISAETDRGLARTFDKWVDG